MQGKASWQVERTWDEFLALEKGEPRRRFRPLYELLAPGFQFD
jgi:hypothetical protein